MIIKFFLSFKRGHELLQCGYFHLWYIQCVKIIVKTSFPATKQDCSEYVTK